MPLSRHDFFHFFLRTQYEVKLMLSIALRHIYILRLKWRIKKVKHEIFVRSSLDVPFLNLLSEHKAQIVSSWCKAFIRKKWIQKLKIYECFLRLLRERVRIISSMTLSFGSIHTSELWDKGKIQIKEKTRS